MFKNEKLFVAAISFLAAALFLGALTAYAETGTCNGAIEGYTCNNVTDPDPYTPYNQEAQDCLPAEGAANGFMAPLPLDLPTGIDFTGWAKGHYNINSGTTEFNAHPNSGYYSDSGMTIPYHADLGIAQESYTGYAPNESNLAACVDVAETKDPPEDGIPEQQFPLKGYAWNTNLGFISFYCGADGKNIDDSDCGSIPYGVTLDKIDVDGKRGFTSNSYAWNPIFGYISFKGTGYSEVTYTPFVTNNFRLTIINPSSPADGYYLDGLAYVCKSTGKVVVNSEEQDVSSCVTGAQNFGLAGVEEVGPPSGGAGTSSIKKWSILYNASEFFSASDLEAYLESLTTGTNYTVKYFEGGAGSVSPHSPVPTDDYYPYLAKYDFGVPGALSKTGDLSRTVGMSGQFPYGVIATPDSEENWWYLSGYAYTNAGVYLNFDGVRLMLPHSSNGCVDADSVCVEVTPNPLNRTFDYSGEFSPATLAEREQYFPPIANGKDGYQIVVYPNSPDGQLDLEQYTVELDELSWLDTVKKNQVGKEVLNFNESQSPASEGTKKGGVSYKPVALTAGGELLNADHVDESADCDDDDLSWCKVRATDAEGNELSKNGKPLYKYIFKKKITSYAPTSDANVSATTGTEPPYLVPNEQFPFTDGYYEGTEADKKLSVPAEEKNQLLLTGVHYNVNDTASDGLVFSDSYDIHQSLNFRPAIYLDSLYANQSDDYLPEFAGLPVPFKVGLKEASGGPGDIPEGFSDEVEDTLKLSLYLDYARKWVVDECEGAPNSNLLISFQNSTYPPYEYNPNLTDRSSLVLPDEADEGEYTGEPLPPAEPPADDTTGEPAPEPEVYTLINGIGDLFHTPLLQLFASFAFKEGDPMCPIFKGAVLYSQISYTYDENDIKYYSNKLPRLLNAPTDAGAYITGNIYAQYIKGTASENVSPLYSKSDKVLNEVRDAISKNLGKYFGTSGAVETKCSNINITDIGAFIGSGAPSCAKSLNLRNGKDKLFYMPFDGQDGTKAVHLSLSALADFPQDGDESEATYVLVVKGANVYIDSDLYGGNMPKKLIIVSLKGGSEDEAGVSGNVFLKYDVKNVNATVFADGALMSYIPLPAGPAGGPSVGFSMHALLAKIEEYQGEKGAPDPELTGMVEELINKLKENGYQLSWKGGIASKNTIGGAAYDTYEERGTYFGKGNLPEKNRGIAQLFDLNYLRFFRLKLELCPAEDQADEYLDCYVEQTGPDGEPTGVKVWVENLPIDQSCRKGLTNEMIAEINDEGSEGVENGITEAGCDGIDPLKSFVDGGDLVPMADDSDADKLAQGLYNDKVEDGENAGLCTLRGQESAGDPAVCQYGPEYVNYTEAPESFLFKTQ